MEKLRNFASKVKPYVPTLKDILSVLALSLGLYFVGYFFGLGLGLALDATWHPITIYVE